MPKFTIPDKVYSRGRTEFGTPTGGTRHCKMEGCLGVRIGVRWSDGRFTWPCTKGMEVINDKEWEIL